MTIDLYCLMASPPARAVMVTARRLDVELNIVNVDMTSGQHKTEEYKKINPRQTVPALNDNGYFLGESRAIMMYLCNQYGGKTADAIYPSDPKKRGQVDRALFLAFECYEAAKVNIVLPLVYQGKNLTPDAYTYFYTLIGAADTLIGSNGAYLAGPEMTIADISLFVDVCYQRDLACIDFGNFKNLQSWLERMRKDLGRDYHDLVMKPIDEWKKVLVAKYPWKMPFY